MKLAFDEIRDDEYTEAVDARTIGAVLVERIAAHEHLRVATIGYVFRDDEIRRHGKVVAAEAIMVDRILQSERRWSRFVKWSLQRVLSGALPDFLILIDRNIWDGLDPAQRIALMDHELSHCDQAREDDGETPKFTREGNPVWAIKGHDVEAFCGEIERNGLWNEELVNVARTIIDRLQAERPSKVA